MRLSRKVVLIIIVTITTIISVMFYVLGIHFDNQIENHLLTTARSIYNNVILIRQWVSDNDGVFVIKRQGKEPNPFLPHPELLTVHNDTLVLRNPALVTRELSRLSNSIGNQVSFHLTSLNYLNPGNKPDEFEAAALNHFIDSLRDEKSFEFYQTEKKEGTEYFRYFAPLYTEESCLTCHSHQGYELGDLRGGISILLPIDEHKQAKKEHLIFFTITGLLAIVTLSGPIFWAIRRSVLNPISEIKQTAQKIREGNYDDKLTYSSSDEIGELAISFENMRQTIKDSRDRLIVSENKYRELSEHSFDAVVIVSADEKILECNSQLLHISGYKANSVQSLALNDLIDISNKKEIVISDPKTEAEHFETNLRSCDGLEIPVEVYRIKGLTLGEQKNVSFVYIRDLSERKKIEEYSIQTEKMFALGQISAGIAHEIRNPLFALSNNLEYMRSHCSSEENFSEIYPEFKESINRIQNLVSSILDYSRPHELSFKRIDIKDVLESSLILVKKQFEKSSIEIKTNFNHGASQINADAHKMEQVFVNLLLNAFQAMPNSGRLSIVTQVENKHISVCIEDTGSGIPAQEIKRIFDPFYSKFANGTGLGMAIVQRILDQHDAHYWIKSEVGLGTKFHILFHIREEND